MVQVYSTLSGRVILIGRKFPEWQICLKRKIFFNLKVNIKNTKTSFSRKFDTVFESLTIFFYKI